MKKRVLCFMLTTVLLLSLLPLAAFAANNDAGTWGNAGTWRFEASTGTLALTGNEPIPDFDLDWTYGEDIPWLSHCHDIKKVVISEGITRVGNDTFCSLFDAYLCSNLQQVQLPSTLKSIGDSAFAYTPISTISIPNGVTEIGNGAFYGTRISSVYIPASVTSIGAEAFSANTLSTISIAPGNSRYAVENNVLYNKEKSEILCYPTASANTEYRIPSTVSEVDLYTFWYTNLQSITIPASVNMINEVCPMDGLVDNYSDSITLNFEGTVPDTTNWSFLRNGALIRIVAQKAKSDPVKITALSPQNGASEISSTNPPSYRVTFNKEIASVPGQEYLAKVDLTTDGGFAIYKVSDNTLVYKSGQYQDFNFQLDMAKKRLSVTPTNNHLLLKPDTEYYIVMKEGFVTFADGTKSPAIRKGDWTFATKKETETTRSFTMGKDSFGFNNDHTGYGNENSHYVSDEDLNRIYSVLSPSETLSLNFHKLISMDIPRNFKGSCFGASAVMGLFYTSKFSVQDYAQASRNATVYDIVEPKNNDRIMSLINAYQAMQWLEPVESEDRGASQVDLVKELIDSLQQNSNPVVVAFSFKGGKHAVLAYAIDDTKPNEYLIYIADPNSLVYFANGQKTGPAEPAVMHIEKETYKIKDLMSHNVNMNRLFDYPNLKLLFVISDLSVFDRFPFGNGSAKISSKATKISPKTTTSANYVYLTSDSLDYTINANGKSARVVSGEVVSGNLEIYEAYTNLTGEDNTTYSRFIVENTDSIEIVHSAEGVTDTAVLLGEKFCRVKSNAENLNIQSDGTVNITGASGTSQVTTTVDESFENVFGITVESKTPDLTLTPNNSNCEISSTSALGDVSVVGESAFKCVALKGTVSENTASVSEENTPDAAAELLLTSAENGVLDRAAITYSVVFYSQGGSFVDAISQIPYGTPIIAPESPTRDAYTFVGWYKDEACTDEWDFVVDTVTEDTILYAKWTEELVTDKYIGGNRRTDSKINFSDVPSNAYYYDAVKWAVENGITTGKTATEFDPNGGVTRAQAVTFLWRAAGCPRVNYFMKFTDLKPGAYYTEAVRWAVAMGITKGVDETHFAPDATCTRAQIMSFLYRFSKLKVHPSNNPFTDVAEGAYYYDAVLWAVANGITGGKTATTFAPNDTCTRAQVVSFLYRYMGK